MNRKVLNAAEGSMRDCSECIYNQNNPQLQYSCDAGLWVSWGFARCNSHDEEAGMEKTRKGASIRSAGDVGVLISNDEEGLLLNGQYRVRPSFSQRWMARIGINEAMWRPDDI